MLLSTVFILEKLYISVHTLPNDCNI